MNIITKYLKKLNNQQENVSTAICPYESPHTGKLPSDDTIYDDKKRKYNKINIKKLIIGELID